MKIELCDVSLPSFDVPKSVGDHLVRRGIGRSLAKGGKSKYEEIWWRWMSRGSDSLSKSEREMLHHAKTVAGHGVPDSFAAEFEAKLREQCLFLRPPFTALLTQTGNAVPWPVFDPMPRASLLKPERTSHLNQQPQSFVLPENAPPLKDAAEEDVIGRCVLLGARIVTMRPPLRLPVETLSDPAFDLRKYLTDLLSGSFARELTRLCLFGDPNDEEPAGLIPCARGFAGRPLPSAGHPHNLILENPRGCPASNLSWFTTRPPLFCQEMPLDLVLIGDLGHFITRKMKGLTMERLSERYSDYGEIGFAASIRFDCNYTGGALGLYRAEGSDLVPVTDGTN